MAVNLRSELDGLGKEGRTLRAVARPASAAPAAGSHHTHEVEQEGLLTAVFN
jgi:2-oxoglutarate dehydrogenase E1 component